MPNIAAVIDVLLVASFTANTNQVQGLTTAATLFCAHSTVIDMIVCLGSAAELGAVHQERARRTTHCCRGVFLHVKPRFVTHAWVL